MSWWLIVPSACTRPLSMQTVCMRSKPTQRSATNLLISWFFSRHLFGKWPRGSNVCDERNQQDCNKWLFPRLLRSYRQHNVNIIQFLSDRSNQFHNSIGNLFGTLFNVVRAHMQHDYLWLNIVQFTVLQSPQRVLRLIVVNAKIQTVQRSKIMVPNFAAVL